MKTCGKCKIEKPNDSFYKDTGKTDGLNSWCKPCTSTANKKWASANSLKRQQYLKQYNVNNREKRRYVEIKRNYGLSKTDYDRMLEAQQGVCAICQQESADRAGNAVRLHVDHCHVSGRIRGLLCNRCNSGIGFFQEDKKLLVKAANYLEMQEN